MANPPIMAPEVPKAPKPAPAPVQPPKRGPGSRIRQERLFLQILAHARRFFGEHWAQGGLTSPKDALLVTSLLWSEQALTPEEYAAIPSDPRAIEAALRILRNKLNEQAAFARYHYNLHRDIFDESKEGAEVDL